MQQDAIIYAGPGKFELVKKPVPTIQNGNDILVKVLAASICGTDVHILANPPEYPAKCGVTIGHELVGEVVECGPDVISFAPGDHLIMDNNLQCGVCDCCQAGDYNVCPNMKSLGMELDGAFAQYCVCPETNVVKINRDVPIEKAIFAEPLNCVMGGLKKLKVLPGDSVVILGGGPIGMYYARLLKQMGAGRIIVSEVSEFRAGYVMKSGADRVVNPVTENLPAIVKEEMRGGADIVVDCVGTLINDALDCVRPGGTIQLFGLNEKAQQTICQSRIARQGLTVLGTFIGNHTLQAVANGLNNGLFDFDFLITHKLLLKDFEIGLDAMRKGTAFEVILYPWEDIFDAAQKGAAK